MATMEKVAEMILKTRKGKLTQQDIKPEAALRIDLGLDSLAMAELLVLAEDTFKVDLGIEDAQAAKTVQQIVDLIDRRIAAA